MARALNARTGPAGEVADPKASCASSSIPVILDGTRRHYKWTVNVSCVHGTVPVALLNDKHGEVLETQQLRPFIVSGPGDHDQEVASCLPLAQMLP